MRKSIYVGENYSESSGSDAVLQSSNINRMRKGGVISNDYAIDLEDDIVQRAYSQVGSQNFVNIKGNWIQGDLDEDDFDLEIKNFSAAYFKVLELDPSLGRYFGLGNNVRLQIGTQVVQFSDEGSESISEKELKMLFPSL